MTVDSTAKLLDPTQGVAIKYRDLCCDEIKFLKKTLPLKHILLL